MYFALAEAIVLAASVLLALPGSSHAHGNQLVSMQPTDRSQVTTAISQVVVTYRESPAISSVTITDPDGDESTVEARKQEARVVIPFSPDMTGTWKFTWTVAQADGHDIAYRRSLEISETAVVPVPAVGDEPEIRTEVSSTNELPLLLTGAGLVLALLLLG